jgi:hypothetical protein
MREEHLRDGTAQKRGCKGCFWVWETPQHRQWSLVWFPGTEPTLPLQVETWQPQSRCGCGQVPRFLGLCSRGTLHKWGVPHPGDAPSQPLTLPGLLGTPRGSLPPLQIIQGGWEWRPLGRLSALTQVPTSVTLPPLAGLWALEGKYPSHTLLFLTPAQGVTVWHIGKHCQHCENLVIPPIFWALSLDHEGALYPFTLTAMRNKGIAPSDRV